MSNIEIVDFPKDLADAAYRVFSPALEQDELVLFHGTYLDNLEAIIQDGFRIPDAKGETGLASVSFARWSNYAVEHVLNKRRNRPGDYCIIAVRYETLQRVGIKSNYSDIHDFTLDPAPKIIAYCIIPAAYEHK